mgnify:CR=1 FL=1
MKKILLTSATTLLVVTILLLLNLLPAKGVLWVCVFIGALGLAYIVNMLRICIFAPIKRDWMLARGNFIIKVISFVLLIPFAATLILQLCCGDFSAKNLTYDPILFPSHDSEELDPALREAQEEPNLIWSVYFHYMDPGNQYMAMTPKGRASAAVMAILGVFLLNGLLISTLTSLFDRRRESWLKGEVRYNYFFERHAHHIVIGGTDVAMDVVRQIFRWERGTDRPYIVVLTQRNVEEFRQELFSTLTPEQQRHVIIYHGSRTSRENIEELSLSTAIGCYIIGEACDHSQETYHDTMNMSALELVADICRTNRNERAKLTCRVMFEYQTSFSVYQFSDISNRVKEFVEFIPFNFYELWAQKVLVCRDLKPHRMTPYLPLEGNTCIDSQSDDFVHLIILGMTRMGTAMAIEAARMAHYPNFETRKRRTRITIIDENMSREKDCFMGRFRALFELASYRYIDFNTSDVVAPWSNPLADEQLHSPYYGGHLGNDFIDIEWEFIQSPIESIRVQRYIAEAAKDRHARLTIASCLADSNKSLAAAIYLHHSVLECAQQILVYQRGGDHLVKGLAQECYHTPFHSKISPFGMAEGGYDYTAIKIREELCKHVMADYDNAGNTDLEAYTQQLLDTFADKDTLSEARRSAEALVDEYRSDSRKLSAAERRREELVGDYNARCARCNDVAPGKTEAAKMWSSTYNSNMIWSKLRSARIMNDKLSDRQIWELALVEHNRWNMEQLLMSYRPLTREEQFIVLQNADSNIKDVLKSRMAHYNICSWERVAALDNTFKYDIDFARNIWRYYENTQGIKEALITPKSNKHE